MNGDELKARVVEINDATVKYKKWENLEGPLYNINVTELFKIKYENGQSDMFNQAEAHPATASHQEDALTPSKDTKSKSMSNGHPIPEQVNVPYYYNANTNTLSELERVTYLTEKVRSGAWGRHNLIILPGSISPVRFSKKDAPKFLIRIDGLDAQPYTACPLNTCEINDKLKRREWIASTTGMHGKEEQHDEVFTSFTNLGDGLYLITLGKKLKDGQLFFMPAGSEQVYAFSYYK